jgi:xanthine phosphoribosyltransferase
LTTCGVVKRGGIVDVTTFLNHQVDAPLMDKVAAEICPRLSELGITKVVTVPTSGIAVAMPIAVRLGVPLVFLRDTRPITMEGTAVHSVSYPSRTKGVERTMFCSREFVSPTDRVLFVDDFLARGETALAFGRLAQAAGATIVEFIFLAEKVFEGGADAIRSAPYCLGVPILSVARIAALDEESGRIVLQD